MTNPKHKEWLLLSFIERRQKMQFLIYRIIYCLKIQWYTNSQLKDESRPNKKDIHKIPLTCTISNIFVSDTHIWGFQYQYRAHPYNKNAIFDTLMYEKCNLLSNNSVNTNTIIIYNNCKVLCRWILISCSTNHVWPLHLFFF